MATTSPRPMAAKAWAKRVAYYHFLNDADYKKGYEHIFGKLGF